MTAEEMFEQLRQNAVAAGKDLTIHTNPDTADRPPWFGLVCVHPTSDPDVEFSADTLTEALRLALEAVSS